MQVGGGVSQNSQPRTKLSIARMAERDPTSVSHPADTSSHKGRRRIYAYAASTSTTSASSRAVTFSRLSPVIAAPSRASRRTPLTSTEPRAETR